MDVANGVDPGGVDPRISGRDFAGPVLSGLWLRPQTMNCVGEFANQHLTSHTGAKPAILTPGEPLMFQQSFIVPRAGWAQAGSHNRVQPQNQSPSPPLRFAPMPVARAPGGRESHLAFGRTRASAP